MLTLQKEYPGVVKDGRVSYGGSQMFSDSALIRGAGCGPVAALDLLRYLEGRSAPQPLDEYQRELAKLCRFNFPLIPKRGVSGPLLALGINNLFLSKRLPYVALWVLSGAKLWARIEEQLTRDLPVILSIGPNFPAIWEKERLRFYVKCADGSFLPAVATKSHYVTVTGMDEAWLRISSWGREYYIKRAEYDEFVRGHSSYLFSNILYIKPTGR